MFAIGTFFISNIGRRPWKPGRNSWSVAVLGISNMDFTQAQLEEGVTKISCVNLFGITRIRVPKRLTVETRGLSAFGITLARGIADSGDTMSSAQALSITRVNVFGITIVSS